MAKKIEIGVGNTSTERLALSDGGYTEADKGENIKWVIGEDSNVSSFRIELKTMPREIFSKRPYKDGTKWKARIKSDAFYDDECKWKRVRRRPENFCKANNIFVVSMAYYFPIGPFWNSLFDLSAKKENEQSSRKTIAIRLTIRFYIIPAFLPN
jgi:hypothetical protein